MLFSATMPSTVKALANSILRNPEYVEVGERQNPVETVSQQVCSVRQADKMNLLVHVLETETIENVIVFSRTKHRADRIARQLSRKGFSTTVLHSNRSQSQRERALKGFRNGQFQILVATNIAARGIDVEGISHVINYDTPQQAEDYIHRIGRTGRAEATGDAITFVGEGEGPYLKDIERHTGQRLERLEFDGLTVGKGHPILEAGSEEKRNGKRSHGKSRNGQTRHGASRNGKPESRNSGGASRSKRRKYA
jgi:ATP-dependent RNA helicase RhlE